MKINKITMIACAAITILSGAAVLLCDNTLIQNLSSGIFTGFIASLVISTIGYFHERNIILEKTDSNIRNLYINLIVISKIIGSLLPQIYKANNMESLPFKNISSLSELSVSFAEKMDLGLFSPFWKRGRLARIYSDLIEFQQVIYNIKNISVNLHAQTMEYTIKVLELQNAQLRGVQPSKESLASIEELRNSINIRSAKLHEYVTGQALELEKIAKAFYGYKGCKYSWEVIKSNLMLQIEDIIKR